MIDGYHHIHTHTLTTKKDYYYLSITNNHYKMS